MKNSKYNIGKKEFIAALVIFSVGIMIGIFFSGSSGSEKPITQNVQGAEQGAKQIWTCSMHPQIRQDKPGSCPICGMDLIPLAQNKETEEADPREIQMTESAMKLADVQTYVVQKGIPRKELRLQGEVKADERNIAALTARFGGRIEKLYVNYTGQYVRKGQKIAAIYSPDLNTAQQELLDAVKYKDSQPSLYRAARNKLKLWELTDQQIDNIEKNTNPDIYFDILSPISGTVTRRDVAVGTYVKEGSPLFEIINLQRVWVLLDAYESDLPWIHTGDEVSFSIPAIPGKTFAGKVSYIDPFINPGTRVAQARVEINNPGLLLKPGMFVNAVLSSGNAGEMQALLIPKTAILWTGKRSIVYVKVPHRKTPSFVFREVTLGAHTGNFYVVEEGLQEGEEIASNGVFKIDASAQLLGKPSMMNPDGGKTSTGHNHGGKAMTDEEMKKMNRTENVISAGAEKEEKQKNETMKCGAGKCGAAMKK